MVYYFLKEDFSALNEEIYRLINNLRKISLEGGRDCQEDRGIFTFEEYERQKNMLSTRIRDLMRIKNQTRVIEPRKSDTASLGSIVTIRNEDSDEVRNVRIGSYMIFSNHNKETISYDSQLAKIIIGGKAGDTRNGEISGKKTTFRILKIK